MKYLKSSQTLRGLSLYALLFFGISCGIVAQEDVYVKLANFSILVETSGEEIKLTCNKGCEWKQLSFTSSIKSDPQAVDQYGMTTLTRDRIKKDSLNADFLFTIKRTQEGVSLEGKAGTMWPSLTFDCAGEKCFRAIDEWGMTDSGKE